MENRDARLNFHYGAESGNDMFLGIATMLLFPQSQAQSLSHDGNCKYGL